MLKEIVKQNKLTWEKIKLVRLMFKKHDKI